MRSRSIIVFGVMLLAGCAVGPDYARPDLTAAGEWVEPVAQGPVETQWWERFGDPALTALVGRLVADNPNLAEARARVAEARALREAAQGGRWPQGGAAVSATENRISENGQFPVGNIPGFPVEFSLFDVGFDASWEVDLWGGTGRAIESAAASEQAAQWAARDVQISLIAELARSYFEYRAAEADRNIAATEAEARAEAARLSELLFAAGETDKTAAQSATSAANSAQAGLSQAEAALDSARYRLALLVGARPEDDLGELRTNAAAVPAVPEGIATGIRSELLERRPDVRRAERELAAATANVGVATAELYPSLTLTGGIGLQAKDAGDLTDGGSLRYSVGPGFRWPIFSLGRIRAQVRAADARADGAAARFEAAIIGALSESEDAANRFASAADVARAATLVLEREREAFRLVQLRHERGEDSLLELEQARLKLAQAERAELQARLAHGLAAIGLYKALGGGWQDGTALAGLAAE